MRTVVMVLTKDILKPHLDARVYKEANSLSKHGFNVIVLCRVYSLKDLERREDYKGITIIRHLCKLPESRFKSRLGQLLRNFKNAKSMASQIMKLEPDIIHAHDLNALLECVLAKRKLRVPLIYDSHEDWPRLEQTKGNNFIYLYALIYERFLLSHVNYIITVNHILAKKFFNIKSTIILYNYPIAKTFKPIPKLMKEIIKKYDLKSKIIIEYHGVLGKVKGIGKIIDITQKLIKKYPNLRVLLIGEDYEQFINILKNKELENYIYLTGPIDYQLIPSYIAVSDISYLVLQPTTQYLVSTPTKLFEAMLLGNPVIANAEFPEVKKVMGKDEKGQPGILINYNDQEIESALCDLIENKLLRKKLGFIGREKAIKYYVWEKQEEKLLKLYNML